MTETKIKTSCNVPSPLEEAVIAIASNTKRNTNETFLSRLTLYTIGKFYIAVDDDAYRLYHDLGWDFTEFVHNDKIYAFMPVSQDGLHYLQQSMPVNDVNIVRTQQDNLNIDPSSITIAQQTADMIRLHSAEQENVSIPLIRETVLLDGDIAEIARLKSLDISKDSISVVLSTNMTVNIVTEHQWNFHPWSTALLDAVFKIISENKEDIILRIKSPEEAQKTQTSRCKNLHETYLQARESCDKSTLPLVLNNGEYITFNDDAITIAELLHIPLYHCPTDNLGLPAIIINNNQLETITNSGLEIHAIQSKETYGILSLDFTESILNTSKSASTFNNIVITKDISGNFFIRASIEGRQLPRVSISNREGYHLMSLDENSKERRLLLSAIAVKAYCQFSSSSH